MIDRIAFAIFAFIDKISKKLDDVLTMDFTNFSKRKKKMIDYTIPYSFEIKEQEDGTFQITICAIGFKTPNHAEEFIKDITNYEVKVDNPTIH